MVITGIMVNKWHMSRIQNETKVLGVERLHCGVLQFRFNRFYLSNIKSFPFNVVESSQSGTCPSCGPILMVLDTHTGLKANKLLCPTAENVGGAAFEADSFSIRSRV
jgi:hypothetical protein